MGIINVLNQTLRRQKTEDMSQMEEQPSYETEKKVGSITTILTNHTLDNGYERIDLTPTGFKEEIESNELRTVIIDNDIYEIDHDWFGFSYHDLIEYVKGSNLRLIVIRNTDVPIQTLLESYLTIELSVEVDEAAFEGNILKLPLLVDQGTINPVDSEKRLDVVYFYLGTHVRNKAIQHFHVKALPEREEVVCKKLNREQLNLLLSKIKESKILYIDYIENIDENILRYLEIIACMSNTFVVFDSRYESEKLYAFQSTTDQGNVGKMRAIMNSQLYKDKQVLPKQRQAFLNNSFITRHPLNEIINGKLDSKRPMVSVICSTNRKQNIDFFIIQMKAQTYVHLQVILLTHGFVLSDKEKEELHRIASFELIILDEPKETSFGHCLNKCINQATYPVVTKIDDDDYYTKNYIIDQWIALKYSEADLVGKASQFVYIEEEDLMIKREHDRYFKFDRFIMGATIMVDTSYMKKFMFSDLPAAVDTDLLRRVREKGGKVYQGHPYEFCVFRGADKGSHTWKVEDMAMMNKAEVICYGDPKPTITID
ncbi:glycosyltransferase family 2 protein [Salinicoccus sp. RF5]|uniref:glycosyltransferase n=1 Tax=Salinicoccus sp. RF5 TaxID=2748874 RepID=UPI001E3B5D2E|nr:glycosyltransferase family A protein [Salinicoccus sp. RF5]MCC4722380.1 glycosyltransferase family 2 protein [Salinicoccus sp. RF5]